MINQDFFQALEDLERQKGIAQGEFIAALENALGIAYKKMSGAAGDIVIKLNPDRKVITITSVRTVVEEVADKDKEISLEDARAVKKSYKVGDKFTVEIKSKDFGRIAAQTARQVLTQKLREIEHENTLSEFEDREGELMSCIVRRIEGGNVYVEMGENQVEGVLVPKDQIPTEKYEINQHLNVYVKKVKNLGRNAQVMVSRSANGLVRRLFENEVPEIKMGVVEIKSIARDPGYRTKIAIWSDDPTVDATGACVGNKGARVNAIVEELGGEKIDIIPWSENPLEFISLALSPARVIKVIQTGDECATAVVPDDKLSLAIGRSGQNARLAVRLTGWKIDVKSESAALNELAEDDDIIQPPDDEEEKMPEPDFDVFEKSRAKEKQVEEETQIENAEESIATKDSSMDTTGEQ